jgi:hypothetical protein
MHISRSNDQFDQDDNGSYEESAEGNTLSVLHIATLFFQAHIR